ncbi:MAG TPA: hypothetical protein P5531_13070 [Bacteroidales bacterium]|nr:hypothetical protein [Bacteroidales bacterium]HSA44466.1 hypothetical protein [Bacteroidales bacterium]
MKLKRITGYVIGIAGLLLLAWSAFVYLSGSERIMVSSGSALFLCFIGAVLIKKTRTVSQKQ